jgi:hypothetical protein
MYWGLVVPIPTLPDGMILILSVGVVPLTNPILPSEPAVNNTTSLPDVSVDFWVFLPIP